MSSMGINPEGSSRVRVALPRIKVRHWLVAGVIAGMVLVLAGFLLNNDSPGDLFIATISVMEGHSTVYPQGYDESKFRSLRVGMSEPQVQEIMGGPINRSRGMSASAGGPTTPGEGIENEIWHYTRAGKPSGNYWRRQVWFENGRVSRLNRTYYVD